MSVLITSPIIEIALSSSHAKIEKWKSIPFRSFMLLRDTKISSVSSSSLISRLSCSTRPGISEERPGDRQLNILVRNLCRVRYALRGIYGEDRARMTPVERKFQERYFSCFGHLCISLSNFWPSRLSEWPLDRQSLVQWKRWEKFPVSSDEFGHTRNRNYTWV